MAPQENFFNGGGTRISDSGDRPICRGGNLLWPCRSIRTR